MDAHFHGHDRTPTSYPGLSTGQKIKPQLKPLIFGIAGGARDTKNQGVSGFCPVLSILATSSYI